MTYFQDLVAARWLRMDVEAATDALPLASAEVAVAEVDAAHLTTECKCRGFHPPARGRT